MSMGEGKDDPLTVTVRRNLAGEALQNESHQIDPFISYGDPTNIYMRPGIPYLINSVTVILIVMECVTATFKYRPYQLPAPEYM